MICKGNCHCDSVQFQINSDLSFIRQCNCSICIRKNAKMAIIPKEDFKLIKGSDYLTLYEFNTKTAKHYFCKICGIYTHHNTRSDQSKMGVNIGCIEGLDPFSFNSVISEGIKLS